MNYLKKFTVFCIAAMLMLNLTGCKASIDQTKNPTGEPSGSDAELPEDRPLDMEEPEEEEPEEGLEPLDEPSDNEDMDSPDDPRSDLDPGVLQVDSNVDWETKEYEDTYLKYEIPANWEYSADYSIEDQHLSFYIPSESTVNNPSNVNIQITSLDNQNKDMDYGDPNVQEAFYQFLLSEGGLPEEAKDGIFTVYQTSDFYIVAINFYRTVESGDVVEQTAYVPVGLDYALVIWATDWNDGVTPSVEEIALNLCSTLEIK